MTSQVPRCKPGFPICVKSGHLRGAASARTPQAANNNLIQRKVKQASGEIMAKEQDEKTCHDETAMRQDFMRLLCPSTNSKIFQRSLSRPSTPQPTAV